MKGILLSGEYVALAEGEKFKRDFSAIITEEGAIASSSKSIQEIAEDYIAQGLSLKYEQSEIVKVNVVSVMVLQTEKQIKAALEALKEIEGGEIINVPPEFKSIPS